MSTAPVGCADRSWRPSHGSPTHRFQEKPTSAHSDGDRTSSFDHPGPAGAAAVRGHRPSRTGTSVGAVVRCCPNGGRGSHLVATTPTIWTTSDNCTDARTSSARAMTANCCSACGAWVVETRRTIAVAVSAGGLLLKAVGRRAVRRTPTSIGTSDRGGTHRSRLADGYAVGRDIRGRRLAARSGAGRVKLGTDYQKPPRGPR